ncbi:MAG: hypothetical protein J6X28_05585 [Bacilli bacterium]|nr:hypothetical protein [Bacilli bacterium]
MNKEGHIDLEKISGSIEPLSSMENIINVVDLSDNFLDIEKSLRQINFEHANCLPYKESMELIFSDLESVKRKINLLADALRKTKANYTDISSFSERDLKEFTKIYKETPAGEDLSKLVGEALKGKIKSVVSEVKAELPTEMTTSDNGNVTTIPIPETTPTTEEPFNTVPIGIAIGATGIAGSIGAVIVDDMYSKKNKKNKRISHNDVYIEEYTGDDILDDSSYSATQRDLYNDPGIVQGPYRAARMEREADRYYGNQLQGMNLSEDDNIYVDADDDDDDNYN